MSKKMTNPCELVETYERLRAQKKPLPLWACWHDLRVCLKHNVFPSFPFPENVEIAADAEVLKERWGMKSTNQVRRMIDQLCQEGVAHKGMSLDGCTVVMEYRYLVNINDDRDLREMLVYACGNTGFIAWHILARYNELFYN